MHIQRRIDDGRCNIRNERGRQSSRAAWRSATPPTSHDEAVTAALEAALREATTVPERLAEMRPTPGAPGPIPPTPARSRQAATSMRYGAFIFSSTVPPLSPYSRRTRIAAASREARNATGAESGRATSSVEGPCGSLAAALRRAAAAGLVTRLLAEAAIRSFQSRKDIGHAAVAAFDRYGRAAATVSAIRRLPIPYAGRQGRTAATVCGSRA